MKRIEPIYIKAFDVLDNNKIVDVLIDLSAKINENPNLIQPDTGGE